MAGSAGLSVRWYSQINPSNPRDGRRRQDERKVWARSDIDGDGREQLATGLGKLPVQLGILKTIERRTRHDQEIDIGRKHRLVQSEQGAHSALRAIPLDGISNRYPGSDHTHPRTRRDRLVRLGIATQGPKHEGAAIMAAPSFANGFEVRLAPQTLLGAKTHGAEAFASSKTGGRAQTTVRRLRPLRRRFLSTLRPPLVAMRARKPILRARFLRCGRKVGRMTFKWLRDDRSARRLPECQGTFGRGTVLISPRP